MIEWKAILIAAPASIIISCAVVELYDALRRIKEIHKWMKESRDQQ